MRTARLNDKIIRVSKSPFPWTDRADDFVYRCVEVRGVFDHRKEMLVGPRTQADVNDVTAAGMLIVTPLRLADGSSILVNRGFLGRDQMAVRVPEVPGWVRVRGVLEEAEIPKEAQEDAVLLKNKPERAQFQYLIVQDLAACAGARNQEEFSQALITAYDVMYEDSGQKQIDFQVRHKTDYLCFWADEHTNFNYAMQWFGMGGLFLLMTVYKFVEVTRWRW